MRAQFAQPAKLGVSQAAWAQAPQALCARIPEQDQRPGGHPDMAAEAGLPRRSRGSG